MTGDSPAVDSARIAVVVVSYGSADLVADALYPWRDDAAGPLLVVVDNFTTTAEQSRITRLGDVHGWTVLCNADNRGFGAAVNQGVAAARAAGCDAFLLLNPDARVAPATLGALVEHVRARRTDLVAPRVVDSQGGLYSEGSVLYRDTGRIRSVGRPVPRGSDPARAVPWVSGACLAVHADLWERVGGLAEDLFLYWEDVDLSLRVQAAGGSVVVREVLEAVHDEGGTQERDGRAKSAVYYRWNCRNRLVVAAATLGRRELWGWVRATPVATREVLYRGGRRQLLRHPTLAWSAVRGSAEGLRVALPALLRGRRRRRVLVVHPSSELYGSDRVLVESAVGLAAEAEVTVVLPADGPLVQRLRQERITVRTQPMPVLRKSALSPRGLLQLTALTVRSTPGACWTAWTAGRDGVYVSTLTLPTWPVLARLVGRRVVSHVHEAERSAPWWVRRALAAPVRSAHLVVINSEFSRAVLVEDAPGVADRVVVVPNAVPGPPVVTPPRHEPADGPRLVFVGRLSPRKGPHVALAVLAELVARGHDAHLELWGSVYPGYEWYEQQLHEQVTAEGTRARVTFVGFRVDVWPGLASGDVVLVPSQVDEPFGNTAVEALLAARPLVVSRTSGLREAAAGYEGAVFVEPGDVSAWADAVERVWQDWPAARAAALRDAVLAGTKHAPGAYRRRVAGLVLDGGRVG